MAGWESTMLSRAAYLVADSGSGGTSVGLHLARFCLEDGGRVLWAAPEMPDPARFSQILGSLSLAASTRFHAMNLIGRMDLVARPSRGPRAISRVFGWWCWTIGLQAPVESPRRTSRRLWRCCPPCRNTPRCC